MTDTNATYLQLNDVVTSLGQKRTFPFTVTSTVRSEMEVHQDKDYGHQGNGTYKIYKGNESNNPILNVSTAPFDATYNVNFTSSGQYTLEIHQYGGTEQYKIRTKSLTIRSLSTGDSEGGMFNDK